MKEYKLKPLITPTFGRYMKLFWNNKLSVLRTLQYESLSSHPTRNKLLDVGGGDNADYKELLNCDTYHSINIDPLIKPTWVVDIGDEFPCDNHSYDVVISMNTLEHIYDAKFILKEIYRCLKTDGIFVGSTPFMLYVHGHPDDYFRPTSSWWLKTMDDIGYTDISITPIVWGPFSTSQASGIIGPAKRIRVHIALLLDLMYAWVKNINQKSLNIYIKDLEKAPLGFFVTGTKQN
jgi:SAM-dependent methyltransferase